MTIALSTLPASNSKHLLSACKCRCYAEPCTGLLSFDKLGLWEGNPVAPDMGTEMQIQASASRFCDFNDSPTHPPRSPVTYLSLLRSARSMCRQRSSECSLRAQRSQARPRPTSKVMWRREQKRCSSCLLRTSFTQNQNTGSAKTGEQVLWHSAWGTYHFQSNIPWASLRTVKELPPWHRKGTYQRDYSK